MARGVNKVILIGNMGADPEIRHMPTGGAVANITVATSESWTDKQTGEKKEKTEWHRCVAYQRLAEIIGEYTRKGSKVYIEGKLNTRKWQDQQGVERYTTEIIIDELQLLDGRGETANQSSNGQANSQAPQGGHQQQQRAQGQAQGQQQQQRPYTQQQGQQAGTQQPYNRPQNGPQTGYMNNGAAINNHRPNPGQQAGFNQPQGQGFNQATGQQGPVPEFDEIPF